MTFKRPPYLMREVTRHGLVVWYFRRGDGPRIRIRGEYGSAEFMDNYNAAFSGSVPPTKKDKVSSESTAWLVRRYMESSAWTSLGAETRRTREYDLKQIEATELDFASITTADILASMEKRASKPSMANHFLKTARGLFGWAKKAQLIAVDPTLDAEPLDTPDSTGHHTWTEAEIAAFERRWPIGSRERLAFTIMLFTGLRRGDASMLGKQHIRRGVVSIATEKNGTEVHIPLKPELAKVIAASKTGDLALVAKENGHPMTKKAFGAWFKSACVAAGVKGTAHGLRKTFATRLAEAGATVPELNAVFGWTGTAMAMHYIEAASRKRLAASGMAKMRNKK